MIRIATKGTAVSLVNDDVHADSLRTAGWTVQDHMPVAALQASEAGPRALEQALENRGGGDEFLAGMDDDVREEFLRDVAGEVLAAELIAKGLKLKPVYVVLTNLAGPGVGAMRAELAELVNVHIDTYDSTDSAAVTGFVDAAIELAEKHGSEFVEVETETGESVGIEAGIGWTKDPRGTKLYRLGPFYVKEA